MAPVTSTRAAQVISLFYLRIMDKINRLTTAVFRYPADVVPTICIVGLLLIDLCAFTYISSPTLVIVWSLLTLGPKICICAWNHHHQHLLTFHQTYLNRILEMVYTFHTGITTNAWVLHHVLGHHVNYLDQDKDESAWKTKDGKVMNAMHYTWTIAVTGYFRAFDVGKRFPQYQKGLINAGVVATAITAGLVYANWLNALVIFVIPMTIGYICTCWHTYYHHAGLDTSNPYEASYNITHRWYNILTGNLGYHTAHHVKPGLHWSKLPEFHNSIAKNIPAHLYRKPCVPLKWLPS